MRIGHCQYEAKTGDFEANFAKVVNGLERADKDRVEVVCFPECFMTAYRCEGMLPVSGHRMTYRSRLGLRYVIR